MAGRRPTESALRSSPRRSRREQRATWKPGSAISFTAIVGLTVAIVALVTRLLAPTASTATVAEPLEPVAYTPDALRPELDEPDTAFVPSPATYEVEPGDTLMAVALKFGSSVEAIRM